MSEVIRVKFPNTPSFNSVLKNVFSEYVVQDEDGNDVVPHYTHDYSIDYIGKLVKTPAMIDEDGNVTTPAELWSGERANIYLHSDAIDEHRLKVLQAFSEVAPTTPDRKFSGE